jgi:hypothetical protein
MDIARWAITAATGITAPKSVISMGGRFGYKDQGQTPNTQLSIFDFGGPKLFFEDRGLKTHKCDNEFYLEAGAIKEGKFYPKGSSQGQELVEAPFAHNPGAEPLSADSKEKKGKANFVFAHFANFIACVRSRNQPQLNAEILDGHHSATLCHLGNASYRLGKDVPFNQQTKALGDDKRACEALEDMKHHLADAASIKMESDTYRLGRTLQYDGAAEKVTGDDEANKLLTRAYRQPFVVPEAV